VIIDVASDGRRRGAEVWGRLELVRGGERDEQSIVDLGVEDGDPNAVGCSALARSFLRRPDGSAGARPGRALRCQLQQRRLGRPL